MAQRPPPGWYTDPANGTGVRWWDGDAWSMQTQPYPQQANGSQPLAQPVVVAEEAATGLPPYGIPGQRSAYQFVPPPTRTPNQFALITLGLVLVCVVLAMNLGIVLLTVIPMGMAFRSYHAKEPLAPLAVAASGLSLIVAVAVISTR